MSNVKISALPLLSCVDVCNSVVPIVQCGVTYKTLSCNVAPPSSVIFTAGSGTCSSVRCGVSNTASSAYSFAGGGCSNTNGGLATSIVGGKCNTAAQYVSCTYNITNSNLYGMGYLRLASCYGDVTSLFPNGSTVTMNSATYGLMTGQVTMSNYYAWIPATVIATTCSSFYCDFTTITGSIGSSYSFIGGGEFNTVCSTSSNIVGGRGNTIHPAYSSIVGGCNNTICSVRSFIGGGLYNTIGEYSKTATITGGTGNCIAPNYNNSFSAYYTFIGGGTGNFASNQYSTIVGGCFNSASGYSSFIGNGYQNTTYGYYSAVVGGASNIASGSDSFIGGGIFNNACGIGSAILGGRGNTASGNYSGVFGCCVANSIACSFASNQLWACNLVGTTVALCVGTNGVIVRNSSDIRLKTNICGLSYGLCDVKKLNPVSFDWNETARETRGCNRQIGFIAQEVEPIIPEAVGRSAESDEMSLSPDKIIPVLTKALQELSVKFDAQEQRIAILEDIIKRNNLV